MRKILRNPNLAPRRSEIESNSCRQNHEQDGKTCDQIPASSARRQQQANRKTSCEQEADELVEAGDQHSKERGEQSGANFWGKGWSSEPCTGR